MEPMTSCALISLPKPLISLTTAPTPHHRRRGLRTPSLIPCKTSSDGNNNATTTNGGNPTPPVVSPPPETVEIRFRRGSRRRSRKQQQQEQDGGGAKKSPAVEAAKDWESMNLGEKAMELYVGEKGLLFWLNKFAYASIFIIIGAWILFRFVGPALNLYQLDSAPLSPTSLLKG